MATLAERYPDNAAGDFYMDRTCIDCDACRRIAPAVFAEAADHSYVARQPASEAERLRALMALVACPTGSIGTASRQDVHPALAAFPDPVAENVSFCGFTSKDSFGAWSYFIERPRGNVLVDSPKAVTSSSRPPATRAATPCSFTATGSSSPATTSPGQPGAAA
jgi:ferredoxin